MKRESERYRNQSEGEREIAEPKYAVRKDGFDRRQVFTPFQAVVAVS